MDRRQFRTVLTLASTIALIAGCSRTDNEPGPGGVTVSEAKALDDAAEMLESRDTAPVAEGQTEVDAGETTDK